MVFQLLQPGHFPSHFGDLYPHSLHIYVVFVFIPIPFIYQYCHHSVTSGISPQGEAFRLPLRGAVGNADRGGLATFYLFSTLATTPHFGHLSSRRGFSAPFEGSCRQRRLRGGISHRKNYIHNFITFHPHCQATNITLTLRFA